MSGHDGKTWYKDAIIYELHVRAFYDRSGDGIGDFRGLIEKLDYLEALGITAIWLLPFYPSPQRDDGYDIAEYFSINPEYGSLQDFRLLLREAHRRDIRVITELVVNHTSDQHPWFQRARYAKPGSVWRNFYVWSDTPEQYADSRIIFRDYETSNWTWDPKAKSYYFHRFYSHQPDLNYDSPHVQKEIFRVLDFWLEMGVDGLRLDAIPYLYEREGTNCENLPETHRFLGKLRAHVDEKFEDRMLLAEANQWPEDAAAYFGSGDECHMNFHFPLMPRMFMGLRMEDRFPIIDILEQTPSIPESCQWAMFLRNHDELTLEMVTDEERDYMYSVYARDPRAKINLGIRRRLAPLLDNNRRKIELMNILLFSLPGTPVIYYGDEIGMGDNYYLGDRNGVRTPMQWSPDRNGGFSRANPQKLFLPVIIDPEYHYEAVNVETQERNLSSLLWWMKRAIAMRKRFAAFGRGKLEFMHADNPKVLVFVREHEDEIILVIINLSRFSQVVKIDAARYAGCVPQEVFSQNDFPVIGDGPYVITLGPYDHHWLVLVQEETTRSTLRDGVARMTDVKPAWKSLLDAANKGKLEKEVLPRYVRSCRWFGGKGRTLKTVRIMEELAVDSESNGGRLFFLEAAYTEGASETYVLPMALAGLDQAREIARTFPQSVIAELESGDHSALLYDAMYNCRFRSDLLSLMVRRKKVSGRNGALVAVCASGLRPLASLLCTTTESRVLKAEQSNSALVYDDQLFLKMYRRLDEGVNPDAEVTRFLSEKARFERVPPFGGTVEYQRPGSEPATLCLLQSYTPNHGDAWSLTLESVDRFFDRVLVEGGDPENLANAREPADQASSLSKLEEMIAGFYLEMVRVLGQRTAELHLALASARREGAFEPEPFSMHYQRSVYQSMRSLIKRVFPLLARSAHRLPVELAPDVEALVAAEGELLERQRRILETKIEAERIRIHGDYHLGQVLFTGKDFVIIDFEGEPNRAASERRLKRSAFRDIVGMLRSFHYAAHSAVLQRATARAEDTRKLMPWIEPWVQEVSSAFLDAYFTTAGSASFLPSEESSRKILLETYLLDKAVYELGYELNNRPAWAVIPVRGILKILETG
jgi:maltose alpha-D-glucosyltransferase/alpha-amylase